eukprot:CAMPEP_0114408564 /NCGR_PEP_ID=MMETSP0102-20121206/22799_1 /TAXON_ID=38822 ORGANISM="Pteridomonas danica, Strain PT" /NCGR_SAMPLE_ID=MMETSP0102 /ASSEMBLY_ACC=CAM_ASM_000212 /LENGTH=971 /DNA_ID=CAMNT_0001575619 /DNA_START=128 /DNA_END=3043 /DNA_ORIENTATION=-
MGNNLSHESAKLSPSYQALQGWTQSRILTLSNEYKKSGAGYLLGVNDIINLVDIHKDVAIDICLELSRNARKDLVNVMTLLATICFLGQGEADEKATTLGKLFKLENDSNENLTLQETTILMFSTSKAICSVHGETNSCLNLKKARDLAEEIFDHFNEITAVALFNHMKSKGFISEPMMKLTEQNQKNSFEHQKATNNDIDDMVIGASESAPVDEEVAAASQEVLEAAQEIQDLESKERELQSRMKEQDNAPSSNPRAEAARKKRDEKQLAALQKQKAELEKKKAAADEKAARAKEKHEKKMRNEALKAEKALLKLEEDDRKKREKADKTRLAKEAKEQAKADKLEKARLKKEEKSAAAERKKQERAAKKEALRKQKEEAAAQKQERKDQQQRLKDDMKARKVELERIRQEEEALRKKLKADAAARAASGVEETDSEKETRLKQEKEVDTLAASSQKLASEKAQMEEQIVTLEQDDERLAKEEDMKEAEAASQLAAAEKEVQVEEEAVTQAVHDYLGYLEPHARTREEHLIREEARYAELKSTPMSVDQARLLSRSKLRSVTQMKRSREDFHFKLSGIKAQVLQREEVRRNESLKLDHEHAEFLDTIKVERQELISTRLRLEEEFMSDSISLPLKDEGQHKVSALEKKLDAKEADFLHKLELRKDALVLAADKDEQLVETEKDKLVEIESNLRIEIEILEKANMVINSTSDDPNTFLADQSLGITFDQITVAQQQRASHARSKGSECLTELSSSHVKPKASSGNESMEEIRARNNEKTLPPGYPTQFVDNLPAYMKAVKKGKEAFGELLPGEAGQSQRAKKFAKLIKQQAADTDIIHMDKTAFNTLSKQRRETSLQVTKLTKDLEVLTQSLSETSRRAQEITLLLQDPISDLPPDARSLLEAELEQNQHTQASDGKNYDSIEQSLATTKELLTQQEFDLGVQRQIHANKSEELKKRRKTGAAALASSRRKK